jgi:co-chaperonin GroES (HSP10)
MRTINPLGKNILVQSIKEESEKKGLILVTPKEDRYIKARVIASGELTEIVACPDTVLIDIYHVTHLGDEWEGLMLVKEDDILAIVEES